MEKQIIAGIRQALIDCMDEKTLQSSNRYFKEGEQPLVYGVGMKDAGKIGKAFYKQIQDISKKEIFEICEELWKSRYLEEAVVACLFSESLH
jgi:hypothetical protein